MIEFLKSMKRRVGQATIRLLTKFLTGEYPVMIREIEELVLETLTKHGRLSFNEILERTVLPMEESVNKDSHYFVYEAIHNMMRQGRIASPSPNGPFRATKNG